MFVRMKIFQKVAITIFSFFMGLMILVTIVAHTRRSGSTKMDMMRIQQTIQQKARQTESVERL